MMETKIVELNEIKLLGIPLLGSFEDGFIHQSWDLLFKHEKNVKWKNQNGYGLEVYDEHCGNKWYYMAAMEVDEIKDTPLTFFAKVLPRNTYITTKCIASSTEIGKTYRKLYDFIIPTTDYLPLGTYDFEFYGSDFKGMDVENSYIELFIPVTKK